jgi:hypothetical protein
VLADGQQPTVGWPIVSDTYWQSGLEKRLKTMILEYLGIFFGGFHQLFAKTCGCSMVFQWPSPKDDLRRGKTGDLSIDQVDRWQSFMTSYGSDLNLCVAFGQQS